MNRPAPPPLLDPGTPATTEREFWRPPTYLASIIIIIIAVAGGTPVGCQHVTRLAGAVRRYD